MSATHYVLLRADGTEDMKQVPDLSLDLMQSLVGGNVEPITLTDWVMLVDEDGLHKRLPMNLRASAIACTTIVGPAVLVPRNQGWG